jgi:DNA-binding transcriptional regulator YdaS (Cro superfamily)
MYWRVFQYQGAPGGNGAKVARAIGVSRMAVCRWGRRVPLESAMMLERATAGALKFDLADYEVQRRRRKSNGGGTPDDRV